MINFDNIGEKNIFYELLYRYVRFAHNLIFYRKYQIHNIDNIPRGVPFVAISNHQNGLSDALGMLFAFHKDGRRPVFIARSDIFRKDLWAKMLKMLRIMPAFRAQDSWSGGKIGDNERVFNKSAEILAKDKGIICLFPEAGHQDRHTLGSFKKGFARIAFKAAEMGNFEQPIYILPMGNQYSNYFSFQSNLLINIGEPFEFSDLYEIYKEHPEKAQKILTDRARPRVEKLMLNIKSEKYYEHYMMLSNIYKGRQINKDGKNKKNFRDEFEAMEKIISCIERLQEEAPDRFDALMTKTFQYIRNLEKLHLRDWMFREKLTFKGFLIRLLLGVVLIPFIIFGFLVNFIPFNASTLITRRIEDQMLHSSFHIVAGIVILFPLWYLTIFLVLLVYIEWWVAIIFVALLPVSLIIYFKGKVLWLKLYNRLRRFQFWFKGNRFFKESILLREEIVKNLDEIVK